MQDEQVEVRTRLVLVELRHCKCTACDTVMVEVSLTTEAIVKMSVVVVVVCVHVGSEHSFPWHEPMATRQHAIQNR